MIPHLDQNLWQASRKIRSRQRGLGRLSAFLLAVALVGLIDGLLAQMRTGSDFLELLPGDAMVLSGPLPLKNPVTSDVQAQFLPGNAPLHFRLDEFFAGYWLGNGMWRGTLTAEPLAEQGSHALRVWFRGTAPSTAQTFNVRVWEDETARRAGSASFIRRFTGWNPFVPAAACGIIAVLCGCRVYVLGRRYAHLAAALGCGEVFRLRMEEGGCRLWCLLYGLKAPPAGQACTVLDAQGNALGEAEVDAQRKGVLELLMRAPEGVLPGSLVCLRPAFFPAAEDVAGKRI